MSYLVDDSPIIACSTGLTSNTAIGIIRLSGNDILEIVSGAISIDISRVKPRHAHFCKLVFNNIIYDEIILTYYKGPHSYNGEDIIELAVHGNQLNINRIISLFIDHFDFRKALPGEFTQRAMRNKKLSLSQVEGLDLLLNASNIFSLDQGFSLLGGDLQEDFKNLNDAFLKHKSSLELGFDFLDDVGEHQFNALFKASLSELDNIITQLFQRVRNRGDKLIKPDIAIYGLPNAGKSSFFNVLLNNNRAIVSNIAGTTRDYLSEDLFIENNIFSLIDTAGLRDTKDQIELSGILLAQKKISTAFYSILLVNPFDPLFNREFVSSLEKIDLVIYTHADLDGFDEAKLNSRAILSRYFSDNSSKTGPIEPKGAGPIEPKRAGPIEPKNAGPIEPKNAGPIEPENTGPIEPYSEFCYKNYMEIDLDLTGVSHSDIDTVKSSIIHKYLKLLESDPILLDRHRDTISNIYNNFSTYRDIASSHSDMAIISSELNIIGHCISELIGIISPDDVLQNIFSNFCIGK